MALGFYVNLDRCIGCRTCQVACKDRHDMHAAGPRPRRVETCECGSFPEVALFHTSISCNHCENPACAACCPTGAMYKSEEGVVLHDDSKCVQCKMCMMACPYGAPQFDPIKNIIVKCDSCKDLREAGMAPNCVAACPMRAIDFGDLDELRKMYGNDCVSELPCTAAARITGPNLIMKASEASLREDFKEVVL